MSRYLKIIAVVIAVPMLAGVSSCVVNTVANPDVISIAGRAIGTVVRGTDEQINSSQSEDSYIQKDVDIEAGRIKTFEDIENGKLCDFALQSGVPKWYRTRIPAKYVYEAKRRGLTVTGCLKILHSDKADRDLCRSAIQGVRPNWKRVAYAGRAIAESKRRGISEFQCARLSGRFTETQIAAVHGSSGSQVASATPQRKPRQEMARLKRLQQSPLPDCPGSPADNTVGGYQVVAGWSNCSGTYRYWGGGNYSGEWKNGNFHGRGTLTYADGRVKAGIWKNDELIADAPVIVKKSPTPSNEVQKENQRLRQEMARLKRQEQAEKQKLRQKIARLEKQKQRSKPKVVSKGIPKPKKSLPASTTTGSGFFISRKGDVVTNAHVIDGCGRITVGDSVSRQSKASIVAKDNKNDLALLSVASLEMASANTQSLIKKLGIKIVPLASSGLLRSDDVRLGERVLVAGFPYGTNVSSLINVTEGIVSSVVGMGDDIGQFQTSAPIQPGNSGGPIYDKYGNIIGVVVAQLNKTVMAKQTGAVPENVNFGIKASTLRQFLTARGVPSKWSTRKTEVPTDKLADVAQKQTVMVMCHQ